MLNPVENLRGYINNRPPLVIFMISVSAVAIAFLTIGYFFKIKEIKSPELTEVSGARHLYCGLTAGGKQMSTLGRCTCLKLVMVIALQMFLLFFNCCPLKCEEDFNEIVFKAHSSRCDDE